MLTMCRLCGNTELKLFHKGVRDNKDIDILKCSECGMLQTSNVNTEITEYYESGNMHQNHYSAEQDTVVEEHSWMMRLQETSKDSYRRAESLRQYCEGKNVLDFGCGAGGFLRLLKDGISKVVCGVELEKIARDRLNQEGIKTYSILEEVEGQHDIITMFHVIEHLEEPKKFI